jgi:hypothetical protein
MKLYWVKGSWEGAYSVFGLVVRTGGDEETAKKIAIDFYGSPDLIVDEVKRLDVDGEVAVLGEATYIE